MNKRVKNDGIASRANWVTADWETLLVDAVIKVIDAGQNFEDLNTRNTLLLIGKIKAGRFIKQ